MHFLGADWRLGGTRVQACTRLQVHYFGVPEPGKLYGKINWRIPKGNSDFIERSTVQTFDQAWLLVSWHACPCHNAISLTCSAPRPYAAAFHCTQS